MLEMCKNLNMLKMSIPFAMISNVKTVTWVTLLLLFDVLRTTCNIEVMYLVHKLQDCFS